MNFIKGNNTKKLSRSSKFVKLGIAINAVIANAIKKLRTKPRASLVEQTNVYNLTEMSNIIAAQNIDQSDKYDESGLQSCINLTMVKSQVKQRHKNAKDEVNDLIDPKVLERCSSLFIFFGSCK